MEHVHIKFHILTFLPIHSNLYRVNIGKRAIINKNIGNIGHFLKDRDFIGNIGNKRTLEGLLLGQNMQILKHFCASARHAKSDLRI